MNRLRSISFAVTGIVTFWMLIALNGCAADQEIQTLTPGVLRVAVTTGTPSSEYDSQLWIRRYVELFATEHDLTISWVVVPFNESWLLASSNEVDLVATNVASFPDRASAGATFSTPFLYERRALRIIPKIGSATHTSMTSLDTLSGWFQAWRQSATLIAAHLKVLSCEQPIRSMSSTRHSITDSSMLSPKRNIIP